MKPLIFKAPGLVSLELAFFVLTFTFNFEDPNKDPARLSLVILNTVRWDMFDLSIPSVSKKNEVLNYILDERSSLKVLRSNAKYINV